MMLAIDVQYDDDGDRAVAAGVVFSDWADAQPLDEITRVHEGLAPYTPGEFYRRELPCLLPLVAAAVEAHPIRVVIVDGYVDVGVGRPGLGRRLFDVLEEAFAVVGFAKNRFIGAPAVEVLRGGSAQPLYVTAVGASVTGAAVGLGRMHGDHRIPTLLRWVDHLARG